jgi:hypothetical protein
MYRLELFECRTTPIQLHLKAGSGIRLNTGRLWLTVEGQCEDVWLRADEQWDAPHDVKVWLSAESVAHFGLLHAVFAVDGVRVGLVRPRGHGYRLPWPPLRQHA